MSENGWKKHKMLRNGWSEIAVPRHMYDAISAENKVGSWCTVFAVSTNAGKELQICTGRTEHPTRNFEEKNPRRSNYGEDATGLGLTVRSYSIAKQTQRTPQGRRRRGQPGNTWKRYLEKGCGQRASDAGRWRRQHKSELDVDNYRPVLHWQR